MLCFSELPLRMHICIFIYDIYETNSELRSPRKANFFMLFSVMWTLTDQHVNFTCFFQHVSSPPSPFCLSLFFSINMLLPFFKIFPKVPKHIKPCELHVCCIFNFLFFIYKGESHIFSQWTSRLVKQIIKFYCSKKVNMRTSTSFFSRQTEPHKNAQVNFLLSNLYCRSSDHFLTVKTSGIANQIICFFSQRNKHANPFRFYNEPHKYIQANFMW